MYIAITRKKYKDTYHQQILLTDVTITKNLQISLMLQFQTHSNSPTFS